jgi:hypothetical protein
MESTEHIFHGGKQKSRPEKTVNTFRSPSIFLCSLLVAEAHHSSQLITPKGEGKKKNRADNSDWRQHACYYLTDSSDRFIRLGVLGYDLLGLPNYCD